MGKSMEHMLGRTAEELSLTEWFGDAPRVVDISPPGGGPGRWEVRRTTFRLGGLPHDLLVLSDVSRPLREQERQAWQRLIRVIGHELGNSLGPIKSIAGSLENLLQRNPPPDDWREDMQRGLQVIASRTDSLSRFTGASARLARLPAPKLAPVGAEAADAARRRVRRARAGRRQAGPGRHDRRRRRSARAAADQPAAQRRRCLPRSRRRHGHASAGAARAPASRSPSRTKGPGLSNTSNLFVPFFTTKPGGSGIGLVLCRQIAEGHGGSLTLENRKDTRGCRARLTLPA